MKQLLLSLFLLISIFGTAQHQDKVDFIWANARIRIFHEVKSIRGEVVYKFKALQNVDSVFLDAKNIDFQKVSLDERKVDFLYDGKRISIQKKFQKGKSYKIHLRYYCSPKQTVYFEGFEDGIEGNEQIWTQGQGKYTSHWLPSFDDMEEKVRYTFNFFVDKRLNVIANGSLAAPAKDFYESPGFQAKDSKLEYYPVRSWQFYMQKPMSSYLLAFAIGNYKKQVLKSESGIPIENYYYPQDSLKVEPTYRHTKEIFDFLEKEIGVDYPWQNYKQIPVHDFLYAGMENTTATIFSDQYMIDSTAFVDKNYVNVNAHEMAHQWFGNLVTEKSGDHHWLHEGFATYYAYLAEQYLFGEDHFYWKLYETLNQLKDNADRGEGQALVNPKASSLTFYEKGAWALFMLRNEVGDVDFRKGIKSYLEKHQFKNATIDDFLKEMESTNGKKLSAFREEWLENKGLPFEKAKKQLIENSPSIRLLSDMEADLKAAQSDDIDYRKYWDASNSIHLKKHLLENYEKVMLFDGMKKAFESDTIPIRQAMLQAAPFDDFLPEEYLVSFLEEESYISKEMALFQLWQGYPKDRVKFLEKTKEVVGLPNKNVRLMWLTLAMLTEGYEPLRAKEYFEELSGYTNPEHSFEVRQGAFFYLKEAFGFNDKSLGNLIQATSHHSWQFRKYARNLLGELLEDSDYKTRLEKLSRELKPDETRYLISKLQE